MPRPRRQVRPIRTRKTGWVLLAPDRSSGRFGGLSAGVPYEAHDRARCARERCPVGDNHDAPHLHGTCGFHGSALDPFGWMLPDAALLDVELFGRVIRHERGWRASGQRVLGAGFVRGCASCLQSVPRPALVPVPSPVDTRGMLVAPRCARCARIWRSDAHDTELSAGELAGLLQTEVSWLDAATSERILRRRAKVQRPARERASLRSGPGPRAA